MPSTRYKYRITIVDRPGYLGEHLQLGRKADAIAATKEALRKFRPRIAALWTDGDPYIMVEERRYGDHRTVAQWIGKNGKWELARNDLW